MRYKDRIAAAQYLAKRLQQYAGQHDVIVLGLPRGGVPVAAVVAAVLKVSFDIVVPRKIGAPGNPEFALGAVLPNGTTYLDQSTIAQLGVTKPQLFAAIRKQQAEAQRRVELYRAGLPPLVLKNKTVLLIDDGIATGATMLAAIRYVKKFHPQSVVVAVPVAALDTVERLRQQGITVIVPHTPELFGAVGEYYEQFNQVTDQEVIALLQRPDHVPDSAQ
jgi:predicted phosphoribosyltransferase